MGDSNFLRRFREIVQEEQMADLVLYLGPPIDQDVPIEALGFVLPPRDLFSEDNHG